MNIDDTTVEIPSRGFMQGGLYVMRSARIYCLAVCHKIGVNGHGPHKHNDWLSFELCLDGVPLIVDPGTYCYTGDIASRRMFRSTAYHNTVKVDGEEQIPIEKTIFGLRNPVGDASVISWDTDNTRDELVAEHSGYSRMKDPVVHRRRFALDKTSHLLEISDVITGKGVHGLEWNFHWAPDISPIIVRDKVSVYMGENKLLDIKIGSGLLCAESVDGWVSERYNQRERAGIIRLKTEADVELPFEVIFEFIPETY